MTQPGFPDNVPTADGSEPTPDGLKLSQSGAVLGRPDLEYGASGMVKPKTAEGTSSATEREIRGAESVDDVEGVEPKSAGQRNPGR